MTLFQPFVQIMPLYEFVCAMCQKEHELLLKNHDCSNVACPSCGSSELVKKWSVFAASASESMPSMDCSGNPSSCGRCHMDN
ncbi:MAG: FmdB family zinc ribbon protein [Limisphaerales bacterium]